MSTEYTMQDVEQKLARLRRTTYKPVVVAGDGALTASKFSGLPWMGEGEQWPYCKGCREPMGLFLQLDLDSLPGELVGQYGSGLLQLFYCMFDNGCDATTGMVEDIEYTGLLRIVKPDTVNRNITPPEGKVMFPARTITGWIAYAEYYDNRYGGTRYKLEGVDLTRDELDFLQTLEEQSVSKLHRSLIKPGDKLAGWHYWLQDPDYPACPVCQKPMQLVFQIDQNDNLPFDFGDQGCGHIFQCADHKDRLAFTWECG